MCPWLAKIIRGRSQQVKVRRGAEMGSTAVYGPTKAQVVPEKLAIYWKLIIAIMKL